jgi:hypothetical protein
MERMTPAPYVPGRPAGILPLLEAPARPAPVRRPLLTIVREAVAIVRDVLLIALIVGVLVLGGRVIAAVHDGLQQQQGVAGTNVPADPPLPVDECGGGLC